MFVEFLITKFITDRRISEFRHFFRKVKDTLIVRKGEEKERQGIHLLDWMKGTVTNCYSSAVEVSSSRKDGAVSWVSVNVYMHIKVHI